MAKHSFLILGGGTAGWMSALLFNRAFPEAAITLVESSQLGTIGVGEGSTPALKSFMDAVGIAEHEWMPRCGATYKSGIRFKNWSKTPGFESYFHPFLTQFDRDHIKALQFNSLLRRSGRDAHAHPDIFSYSSYLAEQSLCPIPPYSFPFFVQYGYHFNAGLLAEMMKEIALERGVVWQDATVASVERAENGDISHLVTESGEELHADFFVDCSGFRSVITREALGIEYISYSDKLFNDRALTVATDGEQHPSTQTTATALGNGWCWHIPQQGRVGNGYVYSSRFATREEAHRELCDHLGLDAESTQTREIRFETGRAVSFWNRNTLAVGLSQGFLEPLEATALALVQLTLARFVRNYRAGNGTNQYADAFNADIAAAFDGVRDYLHTHFLISNRDDTEYWRVCRSNGRAVSPQLKQVIETWFGRGDLAPTLKETGLGRHYKLNSWLYILAGMGVFPPGEKLAEPSAAELSKVPLGEIETFFRKCTLNHMPQDDAFAMLRDGKLPNAHEATEVQSDKALEDLLGLDFAMAGAS